MRGLEDDVSKKQQRRRAIWPWLVLLAITLMTIYAYGQAIAAWEDLVRTWDDLVQLFWLIVPDEQFKG